jgi:hypothetical protein
MSAVQLQFDIQYECNMYQQLHSYYNFMRVQIKVTDEYSV